MAKVSYPYAAYPISPTPVHPGGTTAYRPITIATVTAVTGESLRYAVLLDTGADACLFPLSLALLLKLDLLKLPKQYTGGVGGRSLTYYADLTIDLGDGIVFTARAGFTAGMDSHGIGLLGQDGFFDRYAVEFRHASKTFTIEMP